MSVASEQNCDVHLHAEIEVLKQALVEKQNQLIAMETACLRESDRQAELEDSIIAWQDKYDRLYESHKRVQKVNQSLEDKLLKLVDRNSGERAQLTSDVATLSVRLAQANYNIAKLQREIERYKTDINLAIQLLQCKPDSFLPQKISSLPMDIQSKVSSYMRLETNSHSDSEGSTNGVGVSTSGSYKVLPASDSPPPVCPFPPTAMVYSMRGLDAQISDSLNGSEQMISPSIMVKYLEDELKASEIKHCDTCKCSTKDLTVLADEPRSYSIGTQTVLQGEGNSLCLRCNSNLNSPSRTNSPYIMKLVKSSDSVISETKSTVSDMNDTDKLFTQPKKDDLMVNPILGHHRLCDRTSGKQNQQLCDTAKYFVENRKLDCDLIDFRKHNKSPKMAINNDNYSTCNRSLTSDTMLNDASRKNDCSTLLLNAEAEKNDSNLIQGKGDISVEDRKNDSKGHLESGSSGYSSAEKRNLQTTITGSTNSLWSKTSSSEGAKIFESFNRNLIKTIKAENPKYRGPRLCALRIQNGSNNILLDNIESEITPIVYTRRQRFLDEELDDTKDIITSKISMVMSNQASIPNPNCPTMEDGKNSVSLGQISAGEGNVYDINREDIEPICDATHSNESDSKVELILDNINLDNSNVSPTNALSNQKLIQIDGNSGRNLTNSNSQINSSNNFLELHCDRLKELGIINDSKLEQQKCFDDLDSCENFDDTKSCTQSSSISSNDADIDIQENAILRQQQLTRVAEWVQNNSHIEIVANRQKTSNYNNNVSCSNFSNNCSVNRNTENIPSSLSFNDSSIEKLSIDSGYKTTKLIQNGACNNTSNTTYINSTSTNPVHCQAKFNADNNFCTNDCIAQNSLVNSKYYFNEFAQNTPMHKMQKHKQLNSGNECNLAQMEYNVKQFLLKQNEWCTKNKSTNSSLITNGQNSILVNKCNSNNYESAAVKSHPRRTETNL